MNKDDIKRYIVQIKGVEFIGSGVLIQSDKNSYIFTAKHNLKSTEEHEVNDIEIEDIKEDIENEDIKILAPFSDITIKDAIGLNDNFIDFIILVVDKEKSKGLNNLHIEQLRVFNDDFKECIVAGYPTIRGDNSIEYFDCFYETKVEENEGRDDYQNTFEVYSTKPLYTHTNKEMDTIVGISGGGVFVKGSDDNIYLAGIEIEYKGIRNLVSISLRDVIDEVNQKLEEQFDDKIEVGGFSLYEKFGIDIEKLKLESIKNEISEKNDYINKVLKEAKGEDNEYAFFKKYQNKYFEKINKEYKSVENLAKAFLYNGIVFHENKDYNRATRHFKKAVRLDPSLEVYFAQSKFKRKKGLSDKQKEEIEKNILNISSDNEEKIIENLVESINNEQELESKILHLNHLLYRKITSLEYLGDYYIEGEYKGKEKFTNIEYSSESKEIFDEAREEIIKYTKKLSDFYLNKRDFINAQIGLKGLQKTFEKLLNDYEINKKLLKIYEESQNDFFGNSCIDKKSLLDELISFMDRFESTSNEYRKIKEMIKNISKVDNKYAEFTEKIKKFEKDYDEKIGSLSLGLQSISNNIVDKNVLMKIDFMLEHLTNSHGSLNIKLDKFEENRVECKKNYQNILKIFKMIMEKGNKELEESIKDISNQNSIATRLMLNQLLKRLERDLGNIEIVKNTTDFSELDKNLKEIIADEIESFYTKIDNSQKIIYEKDKIIRLIQKRYGEHVLSLKKSVEDKNQKILDLKVQFKGLNQWLDNINEKYEAEKIQSKEVEIRVNELTEINKILKQNIAIGDSSTKDLKKYKLEIKDLEELVLKLEGKNEQIDDLKNSIKLSSDTANTLVKLSEDNRDKLDDFILRIDEKYQELDNEKKSMFSKEFNEVLGNIYSAIDALSCETDDNKESFEKILLDLEKLDIKLESFEDNIEDKIDEVHKKVDVYPIKGDPEINLHFKKSDLEKIEYIMNKNKRPIWNIYCKTRFVILSVIFTSSILILLNSIL